MRVVVREKKEIHLVDGPRRAGEVVDLPEKWALRYLEQGAVERYETKVVRPLPVGEAAPSSVSPVAPASQEPTPKPSKKRGRPKKSQASSS